MFALIFFSFFFLSDQPIGVAFSCHQKKRNNPTGESPLLLKGRWDTISVFALLFGVSGTPRPWHRSSGRVFVFPYVRFRACTYHATVLLSRGACCTSKWSPPKHYRTPYFLSGEKHGRGQRFQPAGARSSDVFGPRGERRHA